MNSLNMISTTSSRKTHRSWGGLLTHLLLISLALVGLMVGFSGGANAAASQLEPAPVSSALLLQADGDQEPLIVIATFDSPAEGATITDELRQAIEAEA